MLKKGRWKNDYFVIFFNHQLMGRKGVIIISALLILTISHFFLIDKINLGIFHSASKTRSGIRWKIAALPESIRKCSLNCPITLGSWDGLFHRWLLQVNEETDYKQEVIFLPFYQYCWYQKTECHYPHFHSTKSTIENLAYLLDYWHQNDSRIPSTLAYFGKRHAGLKRTDLFPIVTTMSHDFGACAEFGFGYRSLKYRHQPFPLSRMIVLSPNGDLDGGCFDRKKDIVVPAFSKHNNAMISEQQQSIGFPKPKDRKYLAFFCGTMRFSHRIPGLRKSLIEYDWDKSQSVFIRDGILHDWRTYSSVMRDSVFCLIVPGVVGWSGRLGESIHCGCIPVFIGMQNTVLPFEKTLPYEKFSIKFSKKFQFSNDTTKTFGIALERFLIHWKTFKFPQLLEMQKYMLKYRWYFLYPDNGPGSSVYDLIQDEISARIFK